MTQYQLQLRQDCMCFSCLSVNNSEPKPYRWSFSRAKLDSDTKQKQAIFRSKTGIISLLHLLKSRFILAHHSDLDTLDILDFESLLQKSEKQ